MITDEQNEMLHRFPELVEVKAAIWGLNSHSAAGPDGFTGLFFREFWDTISEDLYKAINAFFAGQELPKSWTSTSIVLVPKVPNPQSCSDLRPISLCNFMSKIVTKILNDRLANILPSIISPYQTGFIKGRLISDNILVAQEIMQGFNKKMRGGNIMLKLDMTKAYDRLSWLFIIQTLRAFGFSERWIDQIWRCISNCYYSILINGAAKGFFKSSRGVRQGDPISPSLFIIAAEALNRGLDALLLENKIGSFYTAPGTPKISHLSFADDIILFTNGQRKYLKNLMSFMKQYEQVSGQLVNKQKSCFVVPKKSSNARRHVIKLETGFTEKSLPITYLGCPIYYGKKTKVLFVSLVQSIKKKLEGWQISLLNQAGRLVLIKAVLLAIPIHLITILDPPRGVIKEINSICANFLWGHNDLGKNKKHWIAWKECCYPTEEGGIGIRNLKHLIKAFSMKLYWRLHTADNIWTEYMKRKYLTNTSVMENSSKGSHVWGRIKNIAASAEECLDRTSGGYMWTEGKMGEFTIKSAYEYVREKNTSQPKYCNIWNKFIPKKISMFMWKMLRGRIPVDSNIMRLGFSMASKCSCCTNAEVETLSHLFVTGEVSQKVWKAFLGGLGPKTNHTTMLALLNDWWRVRHKGNSYTIIYKVIPALICWFVWKHRNLSIFEENKMCSEKIIIQVQNQLKIIMQVHKMESCPIKHNRYFYEMGIQVKMKTNRVALGKWAKPAKPFLKLSLASTGPYVAGIIRNWNGSFIWGFIKNYGGNIQDQSIFSGCIYAMQFCTRNNISKIQIEASHESFVKMVNSKCRVPMDLAKDCSEIKRLMNNRSKCDSCLPEINEPVQLLADFGDVLEIEEDFAHMQQLPAIIRRMLMMDLTHQQIIEYSS